MPAPPSLVLFDAASGQYRRFSNPCEVVAASTPEQVRAGLDRLERAVASGLFAAGFLSYEAAPAFDGSLVTRPPDDFPLMWFGIFNAPEPFDLPAPGVDLSLGPWTPSVTSAEYEAAIQAIKDRIAAGDTYQVNHTFRLRAPFSGPAWEVFLKLAQAQKSQYAAFADTGRFAVCSASPELFFSLNGDRLVSRPMKGTAPRGRFPQEDAERAAWLRRSRKNRAENVMIVDMVRNDMGRVALPGTVRVPRLFELERFPTLWQMTSTVECRTSKSVTEILAALFPCASITGAPKCETMRIIARLESTPRRIYTGCMGTIGPGRACQFNVAIRTLVVDRQKNEAEYGVGGGIVWDSQTNSEYEECRIKARVLSPGLEDFSLLETMRWTREEGYYLLDLHLARLRASAAYFDYPLDEKKIRMALDQKAASFDGAPRRVRLLVSRPGGITLEDRGLDCAVLEPVRLALAREPVDSADVFLFHKTTRRNVYESARARVPEADDVILYNEKDEITETAIANLVFEKNGKRYTPPVSCGLLAGTYRTHLLQRGDLEEKIIRKDDLKDYDAVYCINAVREKRSAIVLS